MAEGDFVPPSEGENERKEQQSEEVQKYNDLLDRIRTQKEMLEGVSGREVWRALVEMVRATKEDVFDKENKPKDVQYQIAKRDVAESVQDILAGPVKKFNSLCTQQRDEFFGAHVIHKVTFDRDAGSIFIINTETGEQE